MDSVNAIEWQGGSKILSHLPGRGPAPMASTPPARRMAVTDVTTPAAGPGLCRSRLRGA